MNDINTLKYAQPPEPGRPGEPVPAVPIDRYHACRVAHAVLLNAIRAIDPQRLNMPLANALKQAAEAVVFYYDDTNRYEACQQCIYASKGVADRAVLYTAVNQMTARNALIAVQQILLTTR